MHNVGTKNLETEFHYQMIKNEDNLEVVISDINATKYTLEHVFDNLKITSIKVLGSGYDSVAYLINKNI